jgi:hypothetical protein
MRHAGPPSWLIQQGTSYLVDVALYVRDALALSVTTEPDIPLLTPPVPVSVPAGVDRAAVAEQWPDWWADVLTAAEVGHYAGPVRPAVDAAVSAFEREFARYQGALHAEHVDIGGIVDATEAELGRPARPFRLTITELAVQGSLCHRITPEHVLMSTEFIRDAPSRDAALRRIVAGLA